MWTSRFVVRVVLLIFPAVMSACARLVPKEGVAWYRQPDLFASFETQTDDLSLRNTYMLELATYIGTTDTFSRDETLRVWGLGHVREFNAPIPSIHGYVASNDTIVLVVVCGTDPLNLRDMESNFGAREVHSGRYCSQPEACLHEGFCTAVDSVWGGTSR